MRKGIIILILLIAPASIFSQEVRLGLTIGTSPLERTHWDTDQFSPDNSYHTYLEASSGRGVINAWSVFNSANIGAIFNFSYRRWSFNFEPQYYYERSVYRFKNPIDVKRVVGAKGFRMPMYFTYKFFKKENSSYILFGWNVTKTNFWDFQHPGEGYYFSGDPIYQGNLDFGDDHFVGVLYDNKSEGSFILGLGKQFKRFNSSMRMQVPTRRWSQRLPVTTWRLEWTFSWFFLSTKDFTNKHPLYIDEI